VDSSGHVGQPPIYYVASRIKNRPIRRREDQVDSVLSIDNEFHDGFVDTIPYWNLKLSAIFIFHVVEAVIKQEDILILIDVDFPTTSQKHVRKYIHMLFERYRIFHNYTTKPTIEFRSDRDNYIKTVD
jgi:hypothetical protein